jgi:hypothetical protein
LIFSEETFSMTTPIDSLAACLALGEAHANGDVRTEASRLKSLCEWRELKQEDLEQKPASLSLYLAEIAPRFDKKNARLVRDIEWLEFAHDTYQQYQRAGKRLIDRFSGEVDAAAERRARTDAWSVLISRLAGLAVSGLVARGRLPALRALADIARRGDLLPKDLAQDRLDVLRAATRHSSEWNKVINALRFLDSVRIHAVLSEHLPAKPMGKIDTSWRRVFNIPKHLSDQIDAWVDRAAREHIKDVRFAHHAEWTCPAFMESV